MEVPLRALHRLGQLARSPHARRFELACQDPESAQRAKLKALLAHANQTAYGRAHGLHPELTAEQLVREVPLLTPAQLEPFVRRQLAGEQGVLTVERPQYFVRTTGSTGDPKHVPITAGYVREMKPVIHTALFHLYQRFPEAFSGRALYAVGSRKVDQTPGGVDIGTMSGFTFGSLPGYVRRLYGWPARLFELSHLPTRQFLALWLGAQADPTFVASVFPAPLVFLLRDLESRGEELLRCVRGGALPDWLELPAEDRAYFDRRLARGGKVADRVARAVEAPVEEKAGQLFPRLRLAYTWTGATTALFIPELRRRLGPNVAIRDAVYSACEGFIGVPLGEEEPGGVLAVNAHFFELAEVDEFERGLRRTCFAWEAEAGKRYYILFSNAAGLWRYVLGDVVEVYGFHHRAPKVRFVRKGGAAANLAGEKLEEIHATLAVGKVLEREKLEATYFTLAARADPKALGYVLYLEPGPAHATRVELGTLGKAVDDALRECAFDYDRVRRAGHLAEVAVRLLPQGAFERLRQRKVREGSADSQIKAAHLVPDEASLRGLLDG